MKGLAAIVSIALAGPAMAAPSPLDMAAGLLAIREFERTSCPLAEVNERAFAHALRQTGADLDGDNAAILLESDLAVIRMHKAGDDAAQCSTFWRQFGPGGEVVPDLLHRRP